MIVKLLLQRQQVSLACGIEQVDLICAEGEVEVTAVCEAAAIACNPISQALFSETA